MKVLTGWHEVSIARAMDLAAIDEVMAEGFTPSEVHAAKIALLLGKPVAELEKLHGEDQHTIAAQTMWLNEEPQIAPVHEFIYQGVRYEIGADLGAEAAAKYITLDQRKLATKEAADAVGKGDFKAVARLVACVVTVCPPVKWWQRPAVWLKLWKPPVPEFSASGLEAREALFLGLPITTALGVCLHAWSEVARINGLPAFKPLFSSDGHKPTAKERAIAEKYGWFNILLDMVGGDHDAKDRLISKRSLYELLLDLTRRKEQVQAQRERAEMEAKEAQARSKRR